VAWTRWLARLVAIGGAASEVTSPASCATDTSQPAADDDTPRSRRISASQAMVE
jgi:hypothetical protein